MLLFLAVALVSAGALAYEVLLTRLFSIVQWHHYAYMVISIALLGYGASGAFLALVGDGLRRHLGAAFAAGAALFAVSAVTSFAVAERLPFNALAVIWEPRQLLFLPILYTLFALPFFGAATCIGLALAAFPERVGRIGALVLNRLHVGEEFHARTFGDGLSRRYLMGRAIDV